MKKRSIGALVVKGVNGGVAGIVTSDQLTGLLSDILDDESQDLDTIMRATAVKEIMCPAVRMAWVAPTASVEECIKMMKDRGLRHLPVLKNQSEIVGIISLKGEPSTRTRAQARNCHLVND